MNRYFLVAIFFLASSIIYSQRIKIAEGDFTLLKGVSEYNIVFDFSNLQVINYESEEEFLNDKSQLTENRKKGAGEDFRKSWFNNREALYIPNFIKYFIKYSGNKEKFNLSVNNLQSKYTIKVSSEKIYSGYNVGVWNEEPKLYTTITIYETSNPENVVLKTKQIFTKGVKKYKLWERLASCYGKLGKSLAILLSRKT